MQVPDVSAWSVFLPIGLAGLFSWGIWLYRRVASHRAQPVQNEFTTSTSVVVPVFREDPGILQSCLESWLAEEPDELILVVDTGDRACLAMLADYEQHPALRVIVLRHTGKRAALGAGIRAAQHDVVVVADSDTAWCGGMLAQLLMPFADDRVGGVGTRQSVAAPRTSVWRRVAAWMLDTRYLDYVPAMGARGAVPCLSGRTAAYRRSVIAPQLQDLEHEIFLGRECVAGDDGRMTWLVLRSGYTTRYQGTARVVSMFPDSLPAFVKQRVRWSRNSYRCYVTAAWNGWLWRQPFVTQLTVLQVMLTPVTMGLSLLFLIHALRHSSPWIAVLALCWLFAGRALRGLSHLREEPRDLTMLPLVTLMVIVVALPIKLLALVTMNRQGWLTRHSDVVGGEGQDFASLADHALLP